MSFHTTIARLREAAAARVQGEAPDTCRVQREDLRVALHVIDRLDSELRQAGALTPGAIPTGGLARPELQEEMQQARAALASAPVAGEAQEDLAPPKCPITGRPFFMALEHPELGMVPTYGGPYDSYTIPHLGGKPDQPWHERDLCVYRYDHDLGGWRTDEVEVIPLRIVHEDVLHGLENAAPQASEAARKEAAAMARSFGAPDMADALEWRQAGEKCQTCGGAGVVDDGEITGSGGIEFENGPIKCVKDCPDCAALSAQPGAQKEESRVGTNTGHGHVWRRPDGYLARCGGPAICRECARDQAQAHPDNKDGDINA